MQSFNEKSTVEEYIIEKLKEKGWTYIPSPELLRTEHSEPLLLDRLDVAIKRLNDDVLFEQEDIDNVINELRLRTSGIEGLKHILRLLKYGVPLKLKKEKKLKYIKLIEHENIKKNDFIVTNQAIYRGAKEFIKPDITLYVNGIPLVVIECKNPVDPTTGWYDAYRDIKAYEGITPELFKYCQFGIAAEQTAKYFPIVPWQEDTHIYEWKNKVADPLDVTLEMLSCDTLLDLIKNFIFFREEMGKATKVIARYMQYRAANKIFDRVIDNLNGKTKKKKGLIWHWQGSGKTFTMIFAANKLYQQPELENPSIFFIVDRVELEEQLNQEFAALDIIQPEVISRINHLKRILLYDEGRGKRGIMITLVHKFSPEQLSTLEHELDKADDRETFLNRKNIISFVDEGHRTQYGVLAAQMKSILRNAFFFAFTGTPIAVKGRDTYMEFSYPGKEEPYLDKYFITESIHDRFTVQIVYQPRLEKDVHLRKDLLKAFLEQDFEEVPENIRNDVEGRVQEKLNNIKVFMKNPDRIDKIAKDIANHFSENVDGRFKALVVTVDRDACLLFKRALDRYLPDEYSEVVMTLPAKDKKKLREFRAEIQKKYKSDDLDDIRKKIVENFKEEELPKILIVTEMLLTGFNAPILQVMYLYKPLKGHRLLQALARTNRPFDDLKENGLIIDYVGIFDEIGKAFSQYAEDDYKGVVWDKEAVKKEFSSLIESLIKVFQGVEKDKYDRKTLFSACNVLADDEKKSKQFIEDYRKLRRIFELLGAEGIKLQYLNEYKWLTAIYVFYNRIVKRQDPILVEKYASKYFRKTIKSIYRTTEIEKIKDDLPLISFDENYLKKLEEKFKSAEEKAANIVFALNRFVLVERHKNPLYESIIGKVERLVRDWKERKRSFEKIYLDGTNLVDNIQGISKRQRMLGMKTLEYSILLSFEEILGARKENQKAVIDLMEDFKGILYKGWKSQVSARKAAGKIVRLFLMDRHLSKEDKEKLYMKIMRCLEHYG